MVSLDAEQSKKVYISAQEGTLAGCGGSGSDTAGTGSASASSSGDGYNISFVVKMTDGHFNKVMAGAQAYADENGVNVDFLSPTSSTAYDEQINMIETSLSNDACDAIIIAPLQSESAANLVASTDKTIIACDTDFTSDKKSTFVGTGNEDAAHNGGKAVVEAAVANGVENPKVAILTGVQGDETHEARLKGYTEGAEEAGGEVVEVQYCDAAPDKSATAMEGIIQKYPDGVDVVLCTGDDMALAAAKVRSDSGVAAYDDTLFCGYDGNQSALEALKEGTIAFDIAQEGYDMGYKAVEAAVAVLNGETVDEFIDSGSTIVDESNVDDYIQRMKDIGAWDE